MDDMEKFLSFLMTEDTSKLEKQVSNDDKIAKLSKKLRKMQERKDGIIVKYLKSFFH